MGEGDRTPTTRPQPRSPANLSRELSEFNRMRFLLFSFPDSEYDCPNGKELLVGKAGTGKLFLGDV